MYMLASHIERYKKGEHFDVKRKQKVKQSTTFFPSLFCCIFSSFFSCARNGVKLKYRISEIDEFPETSQILNNTQLLIEKKMFLHRKILVQCNSRVDRVGEKKELVKRPSESNCNIGVELIYVFLSKCLIDKNLSIAGVLNCRCPKLFFLALLHKRKKLFFLYFRNVKYIEEDRKGT